MYESLSHHITINDPRGEIHMIETKIYDVIRSMTPHLNPNQLKELKQVLFITFENCDIIDNSEHSDIVIVDDCWKYDLQDFFDF